jgi:hypothetical protein
MQILLQDARYALRRWNWCTNSERRLRQQQRIRRFLSRSEVDGT